MSCQKKKSYFSNTSGLAIAMEEFSYFHIKIGNSARNFIFQTNIQFSEFENDVLINSPYNSCGSTVLLEKLPPKSEYQILNPQQTFD